MVSASPRTTLARRVVPAVVLLAGAVGAGACTSPDQPPREEQAAPSPTPLASYGTDGLSAAPRDPCAALADETVAEVLGGEPTGERSWAPGERVPGTPEIGDEWGCSRTAGDVTASAWVFSPPVSPATARGLAEEAAGLKCRRLRDAETFGDPGVAFTCDLNTGTTLSGRRGLVGTAWVACEVRGPVSQERVERWCAAVLDSLSQA